LIRAPRLAITWLLFTQPLIWQARCGEFLLHHFLHRHPARFGNLATSPLSQDIDWAPSLLIVSASKLVAHAR
jgi:hypothetical protein